MQLTITLYSEIINMYHIFRWKEKNLYTHTSTSMLKRPRKNSVSISDCKKKNKMVFDKCFVARIYVFICVCLYEYAYKLYIYDDIYTDKRVHIWCISIQPSKNKYDHLIRCNKRLLNLLPIYNNNK